MKGQQGMRVGDYYITVETWGVHVCANPVCHEHYGEDGIYYRPYPWRSLARAVELAYRRALRLTLSGREAKAEQELATQYLKDITETMGELNA